MFENNGRLFWTCGLAIGLLLLPFGWAIFPIRALLLIYIVMTAYQIVNSFLSLRLSRDPYSLKKLAEEVERDERRERMEEEADPLVEQRLCLRCGEQYDAKFPECPHCYQRL